MTAPYFIRDKGLVLISRTSRCIIIIATNHHCHHRNFNVKKIEFFILNQW
jgi:hypothetical protein